LDAELLIKVWMYIDIDADVGVWV